MKAFLDKLGLIGFASMFFVLTIGYAVPENPARITMTRPVCPYPQVPEYRGRGDTNDAANFVCRVKASSAK